MEFRLIRIRIVSARLLSLISFVLSGRDYRPLGSPHLSSAAVQFPAADYVSL